MRSKVVDGLMLGFVVLTLSALVVLGIAFFGQHDHVTSAVQSHRLSYGFPIGWIHQDQSAFSQSPTTIGFASPWSNPTSFSVTNLLLDWLIVAAAVVIITIGGSRLVRALNRPLRGWRSRGLGSPATR